MTLSLSPENINLQIALPASKSISNRALIIHALAYSPFEIENLSDCDDTRVMRAVFDSDDTRFDVGAAGTSMRFLTAFLAKTVGEWYITGSPRMQQRPIRILVDALRGLGGKVEYAGNEGFPPLRIFGSALMGGEIELQGNVSSQYISALMMIAPYMQNGLKINLQGRVISKPYIEMTQKMMADCGVHVTFKENTIAIQPQTYRAAPLVVEADWSAASYWYEVLAIAGKGTVWLKGLKQASYQGDSQVAKIFETLGVHSAFTADGVKITASPSTPPECLALDFTDVPDLAQTVVVTCCMRGIPFCFSGLESLKIKETDRIAALIAELKKLGYRLHEPAAGALAWSGERCASDETPTIATYEDHRMAMAFAPVALLRPLAIAHPEVVSKSYPTFWEDMRQLSR